MTTVSNFMNRLRKQKIIDNNARQENLAKNETKKNINKSTGYSKHFYEGIMAFARSSRPSRCFVETSWSTKTELNRSKINNKYKYDKNTRGLIAGRMK